MKNTTESTLKQVLFGAKSVLVISHTRPDGDTIGSALALRQALADNGIQADVACDLPIPKKYDYLPETKDFMLCSQVDKNYSVYLFADTSSVGQAGDGFRFITPFNVTVNIDHHVSNGYYAKYNYVQNLSSCCEVVYGLLKEFNVAVTPKIANYLILGICTDTGNFTHNNTTAQTLKVTASLMEAGGDLYKTNQKMFNSQPLERSKLYIKTMSGMKFYHNGKMAVICIKRSDLAESGLDSSATEGFIDYPMSIQGVEVGVSIMEHAEKTFKISFRSRGSVDVNQIAGRFGGGGHVCASGAMIRGFLEDVIDKLVYSCGLYLE